MKLPSETYDVEIPSEDGNVVLTFKRRALNDALDIQEEIKKLEDGTPAQVRASYKAMFSNLIAVRGLQRADGSEVKLEDIKEIKLDYKALLFLAKKHGEHVESAEVSEKKDSSAESSPALAPSS